MGPLLFAPAPAGALSPVKTRRRPEGYFDSGSPGDSARFCGVAGRDLLLETGPRERLWSSLRRILEDYADRVSELPVAPRLDPEAIRRELSRLDFETPLDPVEALELAAGGLTRHQVHTPHPMYFGLFNPAPTTMGIAADALAAAFNPQLAAWSHSPFAAEVERHLVRAFGARFGYPGGATEGTFATGGAEANHTAILCALCAAFPEFARRGLRAVPGDPVLYVSAEGHHSFLKAARLCGLGTEAVREIGVDRSLRMDVGELQARIAGDRELGRIPFLVVATAGTTGAGATDPLARIAEIAAAEGVWLHADAAWGGAAALVPELASELSGIERADSITFDAHKWLSVPMGAGLFLTRRPGVLERTFRVATPYMPREAEGLPVADPYAHSIQWSRRFIGLKVFLSLAVAGWDGYAAAIRRQARMGDLLRVRLREAGWRLVYESKLPVVCFDEGGGGPDRDARIERIVSRVVESGRAWISIVRLRGGSAAARACITNYRTDERHVAALAEALDAARARERG
jgi:glutamate/tyrosine decarboxylase-like PLP-dependent enzyme